MKTIKIMCGIPRSGKSTWVKKNRTNEVVVSADDIRYLVYNQSFWSDGEDLVWTIRKMMLRYLLQQGIDIIIDETNTTSERRESIIKMAKKYDYEITCIVVDTPVDTCVVRAVSAFQDHLIPIISKMASQFTFPVTEEGIDSIKTV